MRQLSPLRPRGRPLLLSAVVVLLVAGILLPTPSVSGATLPDHPIVRRANADLGTFQGECWPWVRRVVSEATGHTMGFDYRNGYFEAGAWEVSLTDALPGDVIQLADDADSGAWASYPGLHAAIVFSVDAPGIFTVIDSNSQWDGMVRLRPGYDPAAGAARYPGIDVHVYRFPAAPGGTTPPPGPGSPGTALPTAIVVAPNDCLNLRATPQILQANVIWCLSDGLEVKLLGPTTGADGYEWLNVSTPWGSGWVASIFVSKKDGAGGGSTTSSGEATPPTSSLGPRPETLHRVTLGAIAANATD